MNADLLHSSLGSATAGIISRIVTHPLDTAKARLQSGVNTYKGPIDVLVRTARIEGIRGLYRGFGAILVGGTPGTIVYLTGYELIKKYLSTSAVTSSPECNVPEFVVHFASGMLAETIACIVYVPVDVIKERLQVQQNLISSGGSDNGNVRASYRGSYDALKKILKYEGVGGIYKGYAATLVSFGPFSAIYFSLYELLKESARKRVISGEMSIEEKKETDLPFAWLVACSASAGAAASWITSPLDMAKLRLQVQRGNSAAAPAAAGSGSSQTEASLAYKGMFDCLQRAYSSGGLPGLFRGAFARVMHFTPATCITMTSYETCKTFFANALQ